MKRHLLSIATVALWCAACPGAPAAPRASAAPLGAAAELSREVRAFFDSGRTPSRVVDWVREKSPRFTIVDALSIGGNIGAPHARVGDRLLFINRDRTAIMVVVGTKPLANSGARIIGAHIDTPSPRLITSGLTRGNQAKIATSRYGGLRTHHWPGMAVAVVGRVAPVGGGAEVDVSVGLDNDDFAFYLTKKGRDLVLTTSSTPTKLAKKLKKPAAGTTKNKTPQTFVDLLHARYGLTAADLESSELYVVPRHRAREVGLDRALIGSHGQDDRVNSYAAWRAIHDLKTTPEQTAMVWLVDREEVGSTGPTGAQSRFLELVVAWLLRAQGVRATEATMHRAFAASTAISADTPAAVNPNFPEVHELQNAPVLGRGPALFPFTGRGGKKGGSQARPELIASVVAAFERAGQPLQYGELGRVDEGGGGTIAKYLAHRGVDVVDVGVAVVSMHSPMELSAVADIWAGYRGFNAWLQGN